VQHAERADDRSRPPEACPVCDDERQYVGHGGQRWTTADELGRERTTELHQIEPGLWGIETRPSFAIGQRAHLVQTPAGNLLWESVSSISEPAVARIRELGGAAAIAISHPHFYSSMVEWSRALGGAPIWLHSADRQWVMRPDGAIRFWEGETAEPVPGSGLRLLRIGGHFPGLQGLLWPGGAEGRGALLCGDMPMVAMDPRWLSFMYSYPNLIPLAPSEVRRIARTLDGVAFDRLYGSWANRVVARDARSAVARSAERYLRRVE
jgi:hypothetical protein